MLEDLTTATSRTKRAVRVALTANIFIALMKFTVAIFINSTALLAEGFHSLADTSNQAFLLLGLRLSTRPPDRNHPFGYGMERYFWAFVVSLSVFIIGAVFSVHEGITKILHPEPLRHAGWGYVVIVLSFFFDSYSWRIAFRTLKGTIKRRGVFRTIRDSKTPAIFIIFMEDSAAILGLSIALGGILLSSLTKNPVFDGVASIVIGIILALVAFVLFLETKSLLIGEGVSQGDLRKIRAAINTVPEVKEVVNLLTMHLGPEEILVNIDVNFVDGLNTDQVEEAIDKVERGIQEQVSAVKKIFVEAESLKKIPKRKKRRITRKASKGRVMKRK
ncbi:MAG: cation transporter [Deltaproteobacteria bacterium]|nr:cation transporter [Deltaproteobacteria bacterium]